MKALTLTQPWATLVAIGAKRIETRSWGTKYRGPLAIHAAKRIPPDVKKLCGAAPPEPFASALEGVTWKMTKTSEWTMHQGLSHNLHLGCVIAICELIECHRIEENTQAYMYSWGPGFLENLALRYVIPPYGPELAFGDYTPGRWAWILGNVRALPEPIPAKGALGLWEWTEGWRCK